MRKEMNSQRLNRCAPVFPVSRKKILILSHPPCSGGTGSLHERRPMRGNQTHSVSLL